MATKKTTKAKPRPNPATKATTQREPRVGTDVAYDNRAVDEASVTRGSARKGGR